MNNVAYFIASYGKPNDMPTLKALQAVNVNYPVYIVIGTDDPKLDEYKQTFKGNLLVFDKADYIDQIDDVGMYAKTHKVCTYSRLAITDFAKNLGIQYVVYLFDDINYFQLRYVNKDRKVGSTRYFKLDKMIDMYIKLLNASPDIYFVSAPQSSFYIGITADRVDKYKYTVRNSNMLVYNVDKQPDVQRSSVLEDMDIVLSNNKVGKLSICPFGLQVCCRDPHSTADCYGDMSISEYYQHFVLIDNRPVNIKCLSIPYKHFTPKIISDKYRRSINAKALI